MSNDSLMQFVWKYFSSHDDDMIIVRKSMIDICDGDFNAAMMISQILYWHNKYKDMNRWMKIDRDDWYDQCRLSVWQTKQTNKTIKKLGFVFISIKRFNKLACSHYKINFETLSKALVDYIEAGSRASGKHPSTGRAETAHPARAETAHPLTEHTLQSIQQRGRVKIATPPEFATLSNYKISYPKEPTTATLQFFNKGMEVLKEQRETLNDYLKYLEDHCWHWLRTPYGERQRTNDNLYLIMKPTIIIDALDGKFEDKTNVTRN